MSIKRGDGGNEGISPAIVVKVVAGAIIFAIIAFSVFAYLIKDKSGTNEPAQISELDSLPPDLRQRLAPWAEVKMVDGVQVAGLSWGRSNYFPETITVKAGIPVRVVADMERVRGCMKYFVIPDLNVRKVFTTQDNTVEFTPSTPGTYRFSCTMGMGYGRLVVT